MAEIMAAAEDHRDKVTIILAGYKDDIENSLYAFNSGMASRFQDVIFDDFNEQQLREIWESRCKKQAWVPAKDVSKVAARRIARGIGGKNFGNARSVRKLFETAVRYAKVDYLKNGGTPTITMENLIGKPPSEENIPELAMAMRELEGKTGLQKVKEAVRQLLAVAKANYDAELRGDKITNMALNRCFMGNPGTGKTTVAKIYARILKSLRLLSEFACCAFCFR